MAEIYEVGQTLYAVLQLYVQYLFKLTLEKIKFAPGMIEQVFFPTGQWYGWMDGIGIFSQYGFYWKMDGLRGRVSITQAQYYYILLIS